MLNCNESCKGSHNASSFLHAKYDFYFDLDFGVKHTMFHELGLYLPPCDVCFLKRLHCSCALRAFGER